MSTAIMQQIREMFLVSLESDLPGMLALFLCGVLGWSVTKYFNGRHSSLAYIEAKAKSMVNNHQDKIDSVPKSKTRARKSSGRSPQESQASSTHGASIGVESNCSPITCNTGVPDAVTHDSSVANAQDAPCLTAPKKENGARIAKILAKKAERKARKIQEQKTLQAEQADGAQYLLEKHENAASSLLASSYGHGTPNREKACTPQECFPSEARVQDCRFYIRILAALCEVEGTGQDDVTASYPCVLDYTSQAHDDSDKVSFEEEDVNCVSTADEEEQRNCDAEVAPAKASATPCGESGKMTSCGASEATRSEEDTNSMSDGSSTSEDMWNVGEVYMPPMSDVENSTRVHSHTANDGWMTSFEDAGNDHQLPVSLEQEQAFVHIDATTGNEVWFEPVQQNDDGTQLYSDGQQLYQAVCVRVEDLMSSDKASQVNLFPETAFQSLPTDASAFQNMSSDATFQHAAGLTTLHHQACDLRFAAAGGSCCQLSSGTAGMHVQNRFGDESSQNAVASEDRKMCSPLLKGDEEDETWNMCWDFVSSAWNS